MGRIEDKHKKRKDTENHPLSGNLGKTERTRDVDNLDSETIKDQQNKK